MGKSRERRPNKRFVDDGGYEPVGGGVIKPLNQINLPVPVNKYGKSTNGHGVDKVGDHKTHDIPPRKAVTALPTPPSVDRTTKPPISPTKENAEDQAAAAAGGYEPIGKSLQPKKKDYEDVVFKQIKSSTPTIPLPIPKDVYAKVDLDSKAKEKEAKALKEQKEKLQKQTKEKERKEREKAEKEEKKLKEKQEKERKEREEKERKQREKESKERDKREKSEKVEKEKKDKE